MAKSAFSYSNNYPRTWHHQLGADYMNILRGRFAPSNNWLDAFCPKQTIFEYKTTATCTTSTRLATSGAYQAWPFWLHLKLLNPEKTLQAPHGLMCYGWVPARYLGTTPIWLHIHSYPLATHTPAWSLVSTLYSLIDTPPQRINILLPESASNLARSPCPGLWSRFLTVNWL